MIPEEFYPTPDIVIKKMLETFEKKDLRNWQILEPSAGNGAILDYLNHVVSARSSRMYAIEQDPELTFALQGKKYRVIHNDFLSYEGDYLFDLIVMNPPFSNGDDHLLKAWDIMQSGHIVCLLNAETIRNPYSAARQQLSRIIEDNGAVEFLGPVFSTAARKTDVDIALVRLTKSEKTRLNFEFENRTNESHADFSEEIVGDKAAVSDITGAMLRQYEKTKEAYADYVRAKKELDFYSQGLVNENTNISEMADLAYKEATSGISTNREVNLSEAYNEFINRLKASAWLRILGKLNIEKYLTAGLRSNFSSFKEQQGGMDLTRENIFSLLELIISNRGDIMQQAVVDVFDLMTKFYKENRVHIEGWKTNDAWKVNRKVILPYYIEMSYSGKYNANYRRWDEFGDIDKVMCWLTGKQLENIRTLRQSIGEVKIGDSGLHSSEFFDFRCFKKGTIHLIFKEEYLWARFNQEACKGKNWLPGTK